MNFREAYEQGWNEIDLVEETPSAYVLTLSARITTDNAVTIVLPKTNVVAWADYDRDDDLEHRIDELIGATS